MALTSNINVNTSLNTVTLTASVAVDPVETISYVAATNQITINARLATLISFQEFLTLCDQINIFQTAILFNFSSVNILATQPFVQLIVNELHDIPDGKWNLTVNPFTGSSVCKYRGTKSTLKINLFERESPVTLTFPEWVKFLQALNHYRLSIKAF